MSQTQLSEPHHPRPQWRSRMGFILAALGSAVGLGNIWRFSYLCYKNGGGAFLVPYAIALLVVGIPLMILELGIGHKMRGSAPLSFAKVDRRWEWCGWWAVICAMYGIMLYYSVIIAWCLRYVFFSFNLAWGSDPNNFFFNEFLQLSSGPLELGNIRTPILFCLLIIWALSWVIVYFGVQKGVERANKIFIPLLFVLISALVIWSLSLQGAAQGIAVYLKPNFSLLSNHKIWIDAFSQIFFTLSLAFGIMVAYASYLPRKVNIVKDALIITLGNSAFSFFAGFAVFGTLGYMAFATGKPIDEVVNKSIGLAFVTYPQAISLMPAFAKVFGVLFFTSLVIAGLSSAISLIEAFSAAIIDKFNCSRKTVVSVVCITGFLGSIIFTAESGLHWVDIVDHFITHYGLVVIGILQCILVGWVFKANKLREHINRVSNKVLTPLWDVCIKFITPGILVWILISDLKTELTAPYYGNFSPISLIIIGRDWLLFALFAALVISMRRWRKEWVGEKNKMLKD
ncbi:Sodium-dependent transporter [hydrothermal vent metagenome]|uniref:Sodium-dependent transporter n=1 Tax=hydrothermal vent metagenome TaxID=652676 RepID=A0A3B1DSJ2_9ZZZZ